MNFCAGPEFSKIGQWDRGIRDISGNENVKVQVNTLSPKIDFYVDLLTCATSWASNYISMVQVQNLVTLNM